MLLVVVVAGAVGAVVFFVVEVVPVVLVLDVVVLEVVEGVTLVEPEPLGRACSCFIFKEKVRDRARKSTMIERFFISEKYL